MIRKFRGDKPLSIIKRQVDEKNWRWDQTDYDKGGDWVTFEFIHDNVPRAITYNTFNGQFLTQEADNTLINERSKEMDDVLWYSALLDFLYVPLEKRKVG